VKQPFLVAQILRCLQVCALKCDGLAVPGIQVHR